MERTCNAFNKTRLQHLWRYEAMAYKEKKGMLMNLRVNYVCIKISRRSCDWYQNEFYFYPSWISSIQMKKIILIKVQFNWSNSVWYWRNEERNTLIQAQRSEQQHFFYIKNICSLTFYAAHLPFFGFLNSIKMRKKRRKEKKI